MRDPLSVVLRLTFAGLFVSSCTGRVTDLANGSGADDADGGGEGGDDGQGGNGGEASRQGGQAGGSSGMPSAVLSGARIARLTHFQWQNAARDLLRLKALPVVPQLQADAVLGFDNNNTGTALDVSSDLRSDYEQASESIARAFAGDVAGVAALLPKAAPTDNEGKARALIRSLAERAYRRPPLDAEVDDLWNLFRQGTAFVGGQDAWKAGVEVLVGALLQSPHFVYRTELGSGENTKAFALTPFELASRLSFALTDTMPDDELLEAARSGRLKKPEEIRQQASRLLSTENALASARHFHDQLFRLAAYDRIEKDAKAFATFSTDLPLLMKEETRQFLDDIIKNESPAAAILNSDVSFVNAKLAKIYGLSGTFDDSFKKATLDPSQRRGLLTRAGFLAANADTRNPDPIHRGVFVSQVILCKPLPSPAMNVPPVPVSTTTTNRQRVEAHTGKGTCGATCHATLINPLGYAFESFDALGSHRTKDNGANVDASGEYGELAEGPIRFSDGVELSEQLSRSADFHQCYLSNWLQYLWGRAQRDGDEEALAETVKASLQGQSVHDVLLSFVTSESFGRYLP